MPDIESILGSSRADRMFSSVQPTGESVQSAQPERPVCCGRTSFVVRCGHTEARTYALALPVKSTLPNESPDRPVQNRLQWVTPVHPDAVPVLQILSAFDDFEGLDYVTISAAGPPECPPGTRNSVVVTGGPAAGSKEIPFTGWQLFMPAGLAANTFSELTASLLTNLHPLKLPDLPPRTCTIAVPGCLAGGRGTALYATVQAFPDVRWEGDYTIRTVPGDGGLRHDAEVEGALSVTWNGATTRATAWHVLKPLLPWHGMADELSRMATAVHDLCSDPSLTAYDSSRLQRLGPFQWNPAPALRIALTSQLFEQPDNGLLGHEVRLSVSSDPGAGGEANLLPLLAGKTALRPLILPLLAGADGDRLEDLCVQYGIYLVAAGQAQFRAALLGRRPVTPWTTEAIANREVTFHPEGRSVCEWETVFVEASAADDPAAAPELFFECTPPPLFGPGDPVLAGRFRALVSLTGLTIHRITTSRAGVRALCPEDAAPAALIPPRAWPARAEPGNPPEIDWC